MYLDFLLAHAPDLTGLKVGLDLAHGATYRIGPKLFQKAGAEVMAFFNTPDGRNINRGCGSTHPEALSRFVVELGLDLGLAFDGDGDRVQFIDRKGASSTGTTSSTSPPWPLGRRAWWGR